MSLLIIFDRNVYDVIDFIRVGIPIIGQIGEIYQIVF